MSRILVDLPHHQHATRPPAVVQNGGRAKGMKSLTDLLTEAGDGDAGSWAELVQRFTNLLWAIARSHRLNHDDAADVVQNTWLRLLENLGRIDQPEALPGWLATTARREALNMLRRHAREVPTDEPTVPAVDANTTQVDDRLLTGERDAHLYACFHRLPQRDQQLLRALVADDRPSYAVIGAAQDMPVGSIGPTRMRALKRLHALLDASEYAFRDSPAQVVPGGFTGRPDRLRASREGRAPSSQSPGGGRFPQRLPS